MSAGPLAIRADAGPGIGAGHVMRCIALADAWRRAGGQVDWFCRPLPPLLDDLVRARSTRHLIDGDWSAISTWSRHHPGAWVCIDGYQFAAGPSVVRAAGGRALVLADDARWRGDAADAVLNQVVGAEQLRYEVGPETLLMLGSRYCLLRDEFISLTPKPLSPRVSRVFVSFGGDDAQGQAIRVIDRLAPRYASIHFDATTGVMSSGVSRPTHPNVTWHSSADLSALMHAADAAIVAAGSVCWELAYLGVPAVVMVVADNQEPIADGLHAAGAARSLGWFNRAGDEDLEAAFESILDQAPRTEMSTRGKQLIDGKGADRVVYALRRGAVA
jgi:spore coat polysaccharide biosynthesis predicted glycosyltransferase SpsG